MDALVLLSPSPMRDTPTTLHAYILGTSSRPFEQVGRIHTGIEFSIANDGGGLVTWANREEGSTWDCLVLL